MTFWFLILGAILSFTGMLFHGVVGQKKLMGNVYKSDMQPLTKSLILVSWHVYTMAGRPFSSRRVANREWHSVQYEY